VFFSTEEVVSHKQQILVKILLQILALSPTSVN
jgi:hypothetical protein